MVKTDVRPPAASGKMSAPRYPPSNDAPAVSPGDERACAAA
jgi:hypothetical protein